MPGSFKAAALVVLILAIVITCFFFATKHIPALAQANPFSEDPYDAVGSAGFQFALFTALLSGVRVIRPYPNGPSAGSLTLILRGWTVSLAAVAVTLAADVIALGRALPAWTRLPGGLSLAELLAAAIVLTALTGGLIAWLARQSNWPWRGSRPIKMWVIVLAGLLILCLYPPDIGRTVAGALFTAGLGLALLPAMVWGLAAPIFPVGDSKLDDTLDDAVALIGWSAARAGLGRNWNALAAGLPLGWLNPRRHRWALPILAALAAGLFLAATQIAGEGLPPDRRGLALVTLVFVGGEALAVLMGYALFCEYLALVRPDEPA